MNLEFSAERAASQQYGQSSYLKEQAKATLHYTIWQQGNWTLNA